MTEVHMNYSALIEELDEQFFDMKNDVIDLVCNDDDDDDGDDDDDDEYSNLSGTMTTTTSSSAVENQSAFRKVISVADDRCQMKSYQMSAKNWALDREASGCKLCNGGIIKSPQGSGKSFIFIELVKETLHNKKHNGCTLIVCPKSNISTWNEEIDKHGEKKIRAFYVSSENKAAFSKIDPTQYDIIVVNYDLLRSDYKNYVKYNACSSISNNSSNSNENKISTTTTETTPLSPSSFSFPIPLPPFPPPSPLSCSLSDSIIFLDDDDKKLWAPLHEIIETEEEEEQVEKISTLFYGIDWERVVLDEGQQIKNESQIKKAACALKRGFSWLTTGTLINNTVQEYYRYFNFIGIEMKLKVGEWSKAIDNRNNSEERMKLTKNLEIVMYCIKRQEFRDLEPTIPKLSLFSYRHPFMITEDVEEYLSLREELRSNELEMRKNNNNNNNNNNDNVEKDSSEQVAAMKRKHSECVLAGLAAMRNICAGTPSTPEAPARGIRTTKMIMLQLYIKNCVEENDKIIIFCHMVKPLMLAMKAVKEIQEKPDCPDFLENSLSTMLIGEMNDQQRRDSIDQFRNDPLTKFFFISKAGAKGLNLQVANKVIMLSTDFEPMLEEQVIKRAHRLGQTAAVEVVYLIICGTVEEIIYGYSRLKGFKCIEMEDEKNFNTHTVTKEKLPSFRSAAGVRDIIKKIFGDNRVEECVDERVELLRESATYSSWAEVDLKTSVAQDRFSATGRKRYREQQQQHQQKQEEEEEEEEEEEGRGGGGTNNYYYNNNNNNNNNAKRRRRCVTIFKAVEDKEGLKCFKTQLKQCFDKMIPSCFALSQPHIKHLVFCELDKNRPLLTNYNPGNSASVYTLERFCLLPGFWKKPYWCKWGVERCDGIFIDLYKEDFTSILFRIRNSLRFIRETLIQFSKKDTELSDHDDRIAEFVTNIFDENKMNDKENIADEIGNIIDLIYFSSEFRCLGVRLYKININSNKVSFFVPFQNNLRHKELETPRKIDLKNIINIS